MMVMVMVVMVVVMVMVVMMRHLGGVRRGGVVGERRSGDHKS